MNQVLGFQPLPLDDFPETDRSHYVVIFLLMLFLRFPLLHLILFLLVLPLQLPAPFYSIFAGGCYFSLVAIWLHHSISSFIASVF